MFMDKQFSALDTLRGCITCDKSFVLPGINCICCSSECFIQHLKEKVWVRKKTKKNKLKFKLCKKCNTSFILPGIIDLYCSRECLSSESSKRKKVDTGFNKKLKIKNKRTNAPSKDFYLSRPWQELRYKALKLHGRKCMVCFVSNTELHVDHIKPISKFPDLKLCFDNLQILCRDCNLGKSNKDSIDWRQK